MIASVRGPVGHVGLDHVVVEVGGVGMLVHTTPATAAGCHRGQEATLATSLVVREDSLTLYGFDERSERDMFETVQTVSGVGPRLALAMLSVMGPDELAGALTRGDTKALTAVPGIGAKSAQRLVLELKDKVAAIHGTGGGPAPAGPAAPSAEPWREQVTEALVGLGWTTKQAGDAVEAVAGGAPADADVAAYLRLALRELRR
ncbi:Holliday junction branch migration protein RuvA [Phycicoccus sp. CSK15P-2]|uniref:Holliday junction branch migration protein RuvA n=1 Tax=Phycicoccus sp. CSK15P-2 TaxID=2807627 RepID=UPI00194F02A4|nr:Holliday junction branch migration protein RuvA [Phycicoccus sp. CSK15P-2]MBM6403911.1 Holliday junction branch migration protein RuvA [Phycicoccus sp. CSK15P-2]